MTTYPILDGKVAVITGAAMGMGKEAALLFAEAGAKVVVADVNDDEGAQVVTEIQAAGGEATFVHTDVSDSAQVQAMVRHTVDTFGRLDTAVNNAAINPDNAPLVDFDEDYWDKLMSVDLKGQALCCKYELRQMLAQGGGGSIINISSVSGFRPQEHTVAYVAAKHGVIGLTKVAALEHGKDNIRVNAVAPGAIDTPMLRRALTAIDVKPEDYAPVLSLLGRFAHGREIAQACLWLASDQASYVTGTCIDVDAGYTNR